MKKQQNLWDTAKALLTGQLMALRACIKKEERFQISSLAFHLKTLEKEKTKSKARGNK